MRRPKVASYSRPPRHWRTSERTWAARPGARLEPAREIAVQRGDRNGDAGQVLARHRRKQIEIAHHRGRFGDDGQRMPAAREHLEHGSGDPQPALDRLVWVCIGAEGNRLAIVTGPGELALEQARRLELGEQSGLEVEPGRQPEIGMGRARAAVLAAAIRVDRPVERNVRRGVAHDHAAAGIGRHLGARRGIFRARLHQRVPAIVERIDIRALEAHLRTEGCAAPLVHYLPVLAWHTATVAGLKEHNKNISEPRWSAVATSDTLATLFN